ncbi:MAG: type II secretion system protein GspJ [Mariniblastus sp.]
MIGLDQIFSMRNRNRKSMMARKSSRVGFTLLELLLALGLSIVVVVAIGMAIQTFLIALTKQQAMIERKQIARSVISMISNDLRAGIQYKATDYSGLEKKIQEALAAATGGTTDPDEEPEDSGVIDEEQVDFRPTFIGDSGVVMIDISHLPRLDQYNPFVATEESKVQTPSDVKSVAYFFSASDGGMEDQLEMAQARAPGGLYRRELDRAVATYAGDTQMVGGPDQYTRLIASEIAQVSFRYFDGEDWQEEWDSDEDGGFPAAVEITVVIDAERSVETTQSSNFGVVSQESAETYTKVVNLPIADRPSSSEE